MKYIIYYYVDDDQIAEKKVWFVTIRSNNIFSALNFFSELIASVNFIIRIDKQF